MMKRYSEMIKYKSLKDRFNYLKLPGNVGIETFGFNRYLNQALYKSREWKRVRDQIIIRDNGCELGVDGYPIGGMILIHHLNPITENDIKQKNPIIFDPENLVCVSLKLHNAIHYSTDIWVPKDPIERKPNDMCPWRK